MKWIIPTIVLEFPEINALPQFLDLRIRFKDIDPNGKVEVSVTSLNPNDSSQYFYPKITLNYEEVGKYDSTG